MNASDTRNDEVPPYYSRKPATNKHPSVWTVVDNVLFPKVHTLTEDILEICPVMLYSACDEMWRRTRPRLTHGTRQHCTGRQSLLSAPRHPYSTMEALRIYAENDDTCGDPVEKKLAVRYLMKKCLKPKQPLSNADALESNVYNIDGFSEPVQISYDKVLEHAGCTKALSWVKSYRTSFEPHLESLQKKSRGEDKTREHELAEDLMRSLRQLKVDKSTPFHVLLETLMAPEKQSPKVGNRKFSRADAGGAAGDPIRAAVREDFKTTCLAMECTALVIQFTDALFRNYLCSSDTATVDEVALMAEVVESLDDFCDSCASAEAVPEGSTREFVEECTGMALSVAGNVYGQINTFMTGNVQCQDYMSLPTQVVWRAISGFRETVVGHILGKIYESPADVGYVSSLLEEYLEQRLQYGHVLARNCALYRQWISKSMLRELSREVYTNLFLRHSAQVATCIVCVLELLYGDLQHLPSKRIDLPYDEERRHLESLASKLESKDLQLHIASRAVIAEYEVKKRGLDYAMKKNLANLVDTAAKQLRKAINFLLEIRRS